MVDGIPADIYAEVGSWQAQHQLMMQYNKGGTYFIHSELWAPWTMGPMLHNGQPHLVDYSCISQWLVWPTTSWSSLALLAFEEAKNYFKIRASENAHIHVRSGVKVQQRLMVGYCQIWCGTSLQV
jgi:hypothetical protein